MEERLKLEKHPPALRYLYNDFKEFPYCLVAMGCGVITNEQKCF